MGNQNCRTEKVLSCRVETLRTALYEKEIEYHLLEAYLEEEPDADDPDRPSGESIERDLDEVLEEREVLEQKLGATVKAWSRLAWAELGIIES